MALSVDARARALLLEFEETSWEDTALSLCRYRRESGDPMGIGPAVAKQIRVYLAAQSDLAKTITE